MVLRYRDDEGVKEQRVLLGDSKADVIVAAKGRPRWLCANAEAAGFYRCQYDDRLLTALGTAASALAPVARMALVSDQWALVRAGATSVGAFLDLVASLNDERDHFVLDELIGRLSVIEYRHVAGEDHAALRSVIGRLFEAAAGDMGWPSPGADRGSDDDLLRRAALLRAVVGLARVPTFVAEAERQYLTLVAAPIADRPALALDPNLMDTVVTAAARVADSARFDDMARRATTEVDPATKRRFLLALARVETPALIARAIETALGSVVPMQDFTSYLSVLLTNPATRDGAWALVRDRWSEVHAKADSPMLLRRLVEALASLPERRHLEEVERFLATHPIEPAKQAVAQTLERMRTDVALRERLIPQVARWVRARP